MTPLPLTDTQIAEIAEIACPHCHRAGKRPGPPFTECADARHPSGLVGVVVPTVPELHDPPLCGPDYPRCKAVLDPRWVEAAADTCATCTPYASRPGHLSAESDAYPCPDCFEGSPYHPLTIECDECSVNLWDGNVWLGGDDDDQCNECGSTTRVRVGRLAITTLAPAPLEGPPFRWIDSNGIDQPLRIVGDPQPGDTIAICQLET